MSLIDYKAIIEETQGLLNANSEWRERYAAYAASISVNADFIRANRSRFREWSPFKLYMNTTNAKNAKKSVSFELRYLGQTVAKMTCSHEKISLSTATYEKKNLRDFGCDIALAKCAWDGLEARAFRTYFKKRIALRNNSSDNSGNEEHRIESLLLTEFSKQKQSNKALPNIQPVKIAGLRFPVPTPLSASNHNKVEYANFHGGGIDILARTGTGGRNTYLCIMELKDENKKSESAAVVMKQAVKYTVFIRELLRSEAGAVWWKLFGFGGAIPKKLVLFAACVMPDGEDADISFAGNEYDICGDGIRLHYVYFKENNNQIEKVRTSL